MSDYKDYQTESAVAADLADQTKVLDFNHLAGKTVLAHPNARTINTEALYPGRSRKRGCFITKDRDSFINYVVNNAEPGDVRIFIDDQQMNAKAILNFETEHYEQGHLDHTANLTARKTVVFEKLIDMHVSGRLKQKSFAEFLEDWGHSVIAHDIEGNVIDNAKAVNAVRNMRIDESAQTDSNVSNYRESRSRLESVEAKSIDGSLPAYFTVKDECYQGLSARNLKLRLSISQDDGKTLFKLEVIGLQIVIDELAKEFAAIVADGFDGACEVLIGSFQG